MDASLRIDIVHAREHLAPNYRVQLEGQRAVRCMDEHGIARGELVWRVATGQAVELVEFGIFSAADRRKGLGIRLPHAALEDMRAYFVRNDLTLRRVYLFCEARNVVAIAFYRARGFRRESTLRGFYTGCDAVLYSLALAGTAPPQE